MTLINEGQFPFGEYHSGKQFLALTAPLCHISLEEGIANFDWSRTR